MKASDQLFESLKHGEKEEDIQGTKIMLEKYEIYAHKNIKVLYRG